LRSSFFIQLFSNLYFIADFNQLEILFKYHFLNTIWLIDKAASEIKGAKLAIQFTGYTPSQVKNTMSNAIMLPILDFRFWILLIPGWAKRRSQRVFFVNRQKVFTVTLSKKT